METGFGYGGEMATDLQSPTGVAEGEAVDVGVEMTVYVDVNVARAV